MNAAQYAPFLGFLYICIWLIVTIVVLVFFIRGMRALERIAGSVERIESGIATRGGGTPPMPPMGGFGGA